MEAYIWAATIITFLILNNDEGTRIYFEYHEFSESGRLMGLLILSVLLGWAILPAVVMYWIKNNDDRWL